MNSSIAKLLSQVYELEGLLLVIDKHGADTPDVVFDSIRRKTAELDDMARLLEKPEQPKPEPEPEVPAIQEPEEQSSTDEQTADHSLPDDDYDKEDTWQHDNGEEFKEILSGFDYQEPEHKPLKDNDNEVENDIEEPPVFSNNTDDQADQELRVDEILHRNLSKNLRKAFSLNDHFRFRRELFSNSEADMNDALNLVEAMHSFDEAEEYFYDDLGWDRDNEDVADFMEVIKRHFL
jgi:hypothetical protein